MARICGVSPLTAWADDDIQLHLLTWLKLTEERLQMQSSNDAMPTKLTHRTKKKLCVKLTSK